METSVSDGRTEGCVSISPPDFVGRGDKKTERNMEEYFVGRGIGSLGDEVSGQT